MIVKREKYYLRAVLCAVATALAGCGGHKAYERNHFVLETSREAAADTATNDMVLEVRPFSVDSTFQSRAFVYRTGDFEYDSDSYNWFLASPAVMITEKTRNWLADSGIFGEVLSPGSILRPTHVLQGSVTALYGDARNKRMPKAVLEMRIFLIDSSKGADQVTFSKTYRLEHTADKATAADYVAAVDACLVEILTELEVDLRKKL